ncbi:S-adenosyl-L-methionine-dependent methyltransferases superfamily protein [Tanacetum coccineum]
MATVTAGSLLSTSARGLFKPLSVMGTDFNENEAKKKTLACPICYDPLMWNGDPVFSVGVSLWSILNVASVKKSTVVTLEFIKHPVTSNFLVGIFNEGAGETGFYNMVVVSGHRRKREFELMRDYLKPVIGGTIIDASCGSGMFTRLFAKSGLFSLVVALDFSESMLKQSYDYIKQEESIAKENLILVRADIARLPFASSSIDAVHAGAALHCWPSPSAGVAEISRILRPGGVFVATTYIVDGLYSFIPFLSPIRQNIGQFSGSHIYLSERELRELFTTCGLVDYTCIRNRRFVMISARKPE